MDKEFEKRRTVVTLANVIELVTLASIQYAGKKPDLSSALNTERTRAIIADGVAAQINTVACGK